MDALTHVLAETETNLPKLIFGLIFFAIWALSGLVSWLNKKQQEARRQRVREELERATRYGAPQAVRSAPPPVVPAPRRPQRIAEGIAQRFPDVLLPPSPPPLPPPLPPIAQQRRPVPQGTKPKPAQRRPPRQPQQRRGGGPAPVIPALPPLEEVTPASSYVNITQPTPRAKPRTVDAATVNRWLTPATLRHQFILTEILQPPLALRPKPDEHA